MSVNWNHLYRNQHPPQWYRVETTGGIRYLLMVDMDGVLVSLPYFSWAFFTDVVPENLSNDITFILKSGKLECSDKTLRWQVRMLTPVSENYESHKVVSWLPLMKDADRQMQALSSNVKRKIRKAAKNGITIESGGVEMADSFYEIYVRNLHRLGAPAMPSGFYRGVVEAFGNEGKFLIARYQGRAIGAAVWLKNGEMAEACWFATSDKYNSLYTSYLLWWECIKTSCLYGCRIFSFGRSTRGSGTHHYKCQWGTKNTSLFWSYSYPKGNDAIGQGLFRLPVPGRKLSAFVWKIMPGSVTRWLGPKLAGKFY